MYININKILGWFFFVLACATLVVFACTPFWLESKEYRHSGKELLDKTEFVEFKSVMASEDITNLSMTVLNVDYPVLVEYEFTTKDGNKLFNEDITGQANGDLLLGMFLSPVFVAIGAVFYTKE